MSLMLSQQSWTGIVGNWPLEVSYSLRLKLHLPLFLLRSVEGAAEATGGLKGRPDDEFESSEFG